MGEEGIARPGEVYPAYIRSASVDHRPSCSSEEASSIGGRGGIIGGERGEKLGGGMKNRSTGPWEIDRTSTTKKVTEIAEQEVEETGWKGGAAADSDSLCQYPNRYFERSLQGKFHRKKEAK